YLLLAQLADHSGETLAARPVWDLAPAELWAASSGEAFDCPVVVSLDEHGRVLGVHRSEADARASLAAVEESEIRAKPTASRLRGAEEEAVATEPERTVPVPERIEGIVGRMVFLPALEHGEPVPSIAVLNLVDFFR